MADHGHIGKTLRQTVGSLFLGPHAYYVDSLVGYLLPQEVIPGIMFQLRVVQIELSANLSPLLLSSNIAIRLAL